MLRVATGLPRAADENVCPFLSAARCFGEDFQDRSATII